MIMTATGTLGLLSSPFVPGRALLAAPATSAKPPDMAPPPRGDIGYGRDVERVQDLMSWSGDPQSPLHEELCDPGDWTPVPDHPGQLRLDVDLGRGLHLKMRAAREGREHHVEEATLIQGDRARSLLPEGVDVRLAAEDSFAWYQDAVHWRGPRSRMELLCLFHEVGHSTSFKRRPAEARESYTEAYATLGTAGETLSQRKAVLGEERYAWACALGTVRQLEREGFELLPGISIHDVTDSIYSQSALGSYYTLKPEGPS